MMSDDQKTRQIALVTESKPNNWNNLNNIRCETHKHFRNRKGQYLKDRINVLATNSKNKKIRGLRRGINKFKKDYQHNTKLIYDGKINLLADSHNILNRWKNFFQLLTAHRVSNVRQITIHTCS
jgi:hypothetical protein